MNALAFDVNAACSGFLFALNTADAYLRTGLAKNALIIGSEVLSKLVDWKDRGSCILFGDGAGAVVVERCRTESRVVEYSNALPETEKGMQETAEEKRIPAAGILGRALHSDGTGGGVLQCGARELTTPYARTSAAKTDQNQPTDGREHYIQMDGQEVYRFATRRVPQCIEEALSDAGLAVPDIDMFVLHQANARIIDAVAKRLHADRDKLIKGDRSIDYAEERRLFYVAMTRTKNRVFFVAPEQNPSEFLLELKKDYKNVVLHGNWNEEKPQSIAKKSCPLCGYPMQLKYKRAYGLRLYICTNEPEINCLIGKL